MGFWRKTHSSPIGYWLVGSVLFSLLGIAFFVDALLDLQWNAPNPSCDSPGILFMGIVPWAILSFVVAALLSFPVAHGRKSGTDIFQLRLGRPIINVFVSAVMALPVGLFLLIFFEYLSHAVFVQTITSDCGGKSEMISITRRGPVFQTFPYLGLLIALWFLHLRALFLSPMLRQS
ncbi:MAG: hypothetical protein AAF337_09675 [Pseudomonadota bacterium]